MTTFTTLFGGLAVLFVLYFLLGFAPRLPALFRALIAGGVPLTAYFAQLWVADWPGLDVIAIHISVFIAAAAVLYVLGEYRRRHGRLHWVPRLLIAFFILLALINASLLRIATDGLPAPVAAWWLGDEVASGFSGVVTHAGDAAKGVSAARAAEHQRAELGWQVATEGLLQDGPSERDVVVRARDRTGLPLSGLTASLQLARPGAGETGISVPLLPADTGVYSGRLVLPGPGRWLVEIVLVAGEARYAETRELVAPEAPPA